MFEYLKTMAQAKFGEKGALFVEYALILAFVIVVGVVFLSSGDLNQSISTIFNSTGSELKNAAGNN